MDISRCANRETCPMRKKCVRAILADKLDGPGIYTYSMFDCSDENEWEFYWPEVEGKLC